MVNAQLATLEDVDDLVVIIRDLSRWLKTKGIHQWSESFRHEVLEKEISRGELYVVREHGQVIATVALSTEAGELWDHVTENAVYLHRLAIPRSRSGGKLGEALMAWAESEARKQGASLLRLVCDASNAFLPPYYRKLGYRSQGQKFYEPWTMTFEKFEKPL